MFVKLVNLILSRYEAYGIVFWAFIPNRYLNRFMHNGPTQWLLHCVPVVIAAYVFSNFISKRRENAKIPVLHSFLVVFMDEKTGHIPVGRSRFP